MVCGLGYQGSGLTAQGRWILVRGLDYIGVYIRVIQGVYRDSGKENGNYYIIIGYILSPLSRKNIRVI